ncbi:MAG: tRNA pseudouridine(55) synthase TruB [Flavobacterium sp.]|nr:tRNA pseudouridine(55) synthase TruB [Pedobacter sp.]
MENRNLKKFPAFDFAQGELLLVNKPLNWTSFDVVSKIRNSFKPLKLKVGHAGTLDPLATGLLIICTGKLTKKIDEYQAQEKEYTGTFCLGAITPSYDLETDIQQTFTIDHLTKDLIFKTSRQFLGMINQVPPPHSAVKVAGERLYMKARRGETFEAKTRLVTISEFEITRIEFPEVDFRVVCSKGTYIRSLIYDFGKALQNGAYLSKLKRTRSGTFHTDQAYGVMELTNHIRSLKDCHVVQS